MKTILVIGNCGVGKTWVMLQALKRFKCEQLGKVKTILFHKNPYRGIHVLGKYDGTVFAGSDRLSMAVMKDLPAFRDYLKVSKARLVICEGDRFTNSTFFTAMKPIVIRINGDGKEGREKRGSSQSERQLKAVATRVKNFPVKHDVVDSKQVLKLILEYADEKV